MNKILGIFLAIAICNSYGGKIENPQESQTGVEKLPGEMRTDPTKSPSPSPSPPPSNSTDSRVSEARSSKKEIHRLHQLLDKELNNAKPLFSAPPASSARPESVLPADDSNKGIGQMKSPKEEILRLHHSLNEKLSQWANAEIQSPASPASSAGTGSAAGKSN